MSINFGCDEKDRKAYKAKQWDEMQPSCTTCILSCTHGEYDRQCIERCLFTKEPDELVEKKGAACPSTYTKCNISGYTEKQCVKDKSRCLQ